MPTKILVAPPYDILLLLSACKMAWGHNGNVTRHNIYIYTFYLAKSIKDKVASFTFET